MRSQLTFFMHPDDEIAFLQAALSEPGVVLVPAFSSMEPSVLQDPFRLSGHQVYIWHPDEAPGLRARERVGANHTHWSCENPFLAIQLLRSELLRSPSEVLTQGRIAIVTSGFGIEAQLEPRVATAIESRYKKLSRFLKKTYRNGMARWHNPALPSSPTNPGKRDRSTWLSPKALQWCREDTNRRLKQFQSGFVEALVDGDG